MPERMMQALITPFWAVSMIGWTMWVVVQSYYEVVFDA